MSSSEPSDGTAGRVAPATCSCMHLVSPFMPSICATEGNGVLVATARSSGCWSPDWAAGGPPGGASQGGTGSGGTDCCFAACANQWSTDCGTEGAGGGAHTRVLGATEPPGGTLRPCASPGGGSVSAPFVTMSRTGVPASAGMADAAAGIGGVIVWADAVAGIGEVIVWSNACI
eukprot:5480633-Amphidinium_carterae.1